MIYEKGQQFLDDNGDPLASGTVGFYVDGDTSTLQTVYTTAARDVASANPVTLDSSGRLPNAIHGMAGLSYSVVKKDSAGATIATTDGVPDVSGVAYDLSGFFAGTPTASQLMFQFVSSRDVVLPANLTNSQGYMATAPTLSFAVDIQKNGSSVGTMTFAAASKTATFTFASSVTLSAGDRLTLIAPSPADATAADISFLLRGTAT